MADGEIRVQDEQGNVHVFPAGATPDMIAQAMNVKPPAGAGLGMAGATLSNASAVPNARLRNLPNPAAGETSNLGALYHGAKMGATLASIPAAAALTPASAARMFIGGTAGNIAGQQTAKAAGAGELGQEVSGDVGGLLGAGLTEKGYNYFKPKPGIYPGAPLPANPNPELIQANSLMRGPQPVVDPAAGLGQIPVKAPGQAGSMVQSVAAPTSPMPSNFPTAASRAASDAAFARNFPNETMPEGMTPQEKEIWQERMFGEKPAGDIGAQVRQANPEPTRAEVKAAADKALGVQKLKPDVPLRQQPEVMGTSKGGPAIPEGHTPVESSALSSYKYDPTAREFTAATRAGNVQYVYGDVSPEDAAAFNKAESKGKAWQGIRQNPLVAKIVDGKRIPVKPGRSIVVDPETGKPEFSDMVPALQKSLEIAKASKSIQ